MDWLTPILSYAGDYAKPIVTIAYATFVLVGVLGWYKRYQKIQVKGAVCAIAYYTPAEVHNYKLL